MAVHVVVAIAPTKTIGVRCTFLCCSTWCDTLPNWSMSMAVPLVPDDQNPCRNRCIPSTMGSRGPLAMNGTSCHEVKTFHCDCQSACHTSAWIMQNYTGLQDRFHGTCSSVKGPRMSDLPWLSSTNKPESVSLATPA